MYIVNLTISLSPAISDNNCLCVHPDENCGFNMLGQTYDQPHFYLHFHSGWATTLGAGLPGQNKERSPLHTS